MLLLRLAVLDLSRGLRRSLLAMAAVVAGVAVTVFGQGVIDGFEENHVRAQIDHVGGHVTVRASGYPTEGLDHPTTALAPVSDDVRRWLDAEAAAWTTRTLLVAEAVRGTRAMPVRLIGIEPDRDAAVFPRDTWHVRGGTDGLLVSARVADLLQLEPGEPVVLRATTVAGALNAVEVPVAGVFTAGTPPLDRFGVIAPRALTDALVRHGDAVSHVAVRLRARSETAEAAEALRALVPADREVVTWVDETRAVLAMQAVRRGALQLVVLALMGMSATGIANTLMMAAWERAPEIGTLRALGMTRRAVLGLFVLEGALVGALGSVAGAALGGGLVLWYAERGIELPLALATSGNFPVSNVLYLRLSGPVVVAAAGLGVAVATAASVWPAWAASRQDPAQAIRQ